MRLPRFRFTVRGMMIAVAMVGMAVWPAVSLKRLSSGYATKANNFRYAAAVNDLGNHASHWRRQRIENFGRMADKYEHAALHPWLSVAPDPPKPE